MSDLETKPAATATNTDEAATKAPSTTAENIKAAAVNDADIPAADADVKEGDAQKPAETNGKSQEKKTEPPKDPKQDPVGWVSSLFPAAVHKVNYQVLDWAQQLAVEDEEQRQTLPGKNDAVTKSQFLCFLRDGTLLAKLANRLQPGAIEIVHEGDDAKDKTKQTSNINAFITFAKEKAGLADDQLFTLEDLQSKGKAGYQPVFNTIMQIGMKTQEKFEQKGIDTDHLVQVASQAVRTNLIQTILNFFRRARPTQSPKQLAKEAEEKEKAEKAVPAEKVVEEKAFADEECKKVDVPTGTDTVAVAAR
uniref:Calponin-homology (CH) domain-containing protein n=2 Tax=Parascaris univalens TaxID=6257 RepID=A0A915AN87_PARUN